MTRKLATVAGAPVVESQSRLTGSRCLCAGLATASFPQQPCSALQMLESGPLARRGRATGLADGDRRTIQKSKFISPNGQTH